MHNYIWVFLEKLSLIVIKLIFMAIAARLITPDIFGVFAIAIFLVSSLWLIVDSGMAGSVIKEKYVDEQDYYTLNYFNVVVSVILSFALFLLAGVIAEYYQKIELASVLKALSLTLIFRAFSNVYVAYFCRELRFAEQAKLSAVSAIISVVVTLMLMWQGWTLWALVTQQILESFLILFFLVYLSKVNFFKFQFNKEKFKKHFGFGTRLSLASLVESSFPNIILNQVNAVGGIKTVGNYSQNVKVSDLFIGIMTMTLDKVMMPVMAKTVNTKRDLVKYINQTIMYFSVFSYFCITLLVVCANEIVFILLGKQWVNSAWMLSLIAYCGFAQIIEMVCRSVLKSQGKSQQILSISILKLLALVVVILSFRQFDIKQMLFALIGLSWVSVVFYVITIQKYIGINMLTCLKPVTKSGLASGLALFFYYSFFETPVYLTYYQNSVSLISKVGFIFVIYVISLSLLGFPVLQEIKAIRSKILFNRMKK